MSEERLGEAIPGLILLGHGHLLGATGGLLLLDLEFTCWENSLRKGWPDPSRPPEVLEVGLALYGIGEDQVSARFMSLVRPARNPHLSPYCMNLLKIPQGEIDSAPCLPEVLARAGEWLVAHGVNDGVPTCAWGTMDRVFLTADARRCACADPLYRRPHLDLRALCRDAGWDGSQADDDREAVRLRLGLAANARRHRALDDAIDLVQFLRKLRNLRPHEANATPPYADGFSRSRCDRP